MQNVKEWQKKKCLFFESDEFDTVISNVIGDNCDVQFACDGLIFEDKISCDFMDINVIFKKLSEYFDVKEITSIHLDDCDTIGVWVCYKD